MGAENHQDVIDKLTRLATYRYVRCPFPETVSFAKISESGFYYPGSGCDVICAECGIRVDLRNFSKDPDDVMFHNQRCSFIYRRPSEQQNGVVTETSISPVNHVIKDSNTNPVRDHVPFTTDIHKPTNNISTPTSDEISRALTGNHEESQKSQYEITKQLLYRENQALKQLMTCKSCNEAHIQDLFLPCGEMYTCKDCSNKFTHCPSCGKRILGTVTIFFT